MITERHNIACRMILKAIRKTDSLGSCIASMDLGGNERTTMQNLQIPETAEIRIVAKWLFPPRFSDEGNLPPAAQILCCYSHRCNKTKTANLCRGVGSSEWQGAIEGDWEHPSSTASHQ